MAQCNSFSLVKIGTLTYFVRDFLHKKRTVRLLKWDYPCNERNLKQHLHESIRQPLCKYIEFPMDLFLDDQVAQVIIAW